MSYAVATWADTSTSQAIKDSGQRQCVYSNIVKLYDAAKRIAQLANDIASINKHLVACENMKFTTSKLTYLI